MERLNVLLKDYTIDYEEYFNRSAIGCNGVDEAFQNFNRTVDPDYGYIEIAFLYDEVIQSSVRLFNTNFYWIRGDSFDSYGKKSDEYKNLFHQLIFPIPLFVYQTKSSQKISQISKNN